jgi:hypothetical protein
MATIKARKRADGTFRYTAIVRQRVGKQIVYRDAKTFTYRTAAVRRRSTAKSSSIRRAPRRSASASRFRWPSWYIDSA